MLRLVLNYQVFHYELKNDPANMCSIVEEKFNLTRYKSKALKNLVLLPLASI